MDGTLVDYFLLYHCLVDCLQPFFRHHHHNHHLSQSKPPSTTDMVWQSQTPLDHDHPNYVPRPISQVLDYVLHHPLQLLSFGFRKNLLIYDRV